MMSQLPRLMDRTPVAGIFAGGLACLVLLAAKPSDAADEATRATPVEDPLSPPVVVDDRQPHYPTAEAVARELLELQQLQGGSAVEPFQVEPFGAKPMPRGARLQWFPSGEPHRHWFSIRNHPSEPTTAEQPASWRTEAPAADRRGRREESPARQLREAAWELDHIAHHLESIEHFEHADAIREVAQQIREDARQRRPQR